jgi:hypothetical protein
VLGHPSDDFIQLLEEHINPNHHRFEMAGEASGEESGDKIEQASQVLARYGKQFRSIFAYFEQQGSVTEKGGSFHVNGKTMSVYQVCPRAVPTCHVDVDYRDSSRSDESSSCTHSL